MVPLPLALHLIVALASIDTTPPRPAAIAPESVGMSAERLANIDRVMSRAISAGGLPGGAIAVGRQGQVTWQAGYGRLDWGSSTARARAGETLYDLASLTKVVATTTAIMILYEKGKIRLDDPVVKFIPAFAKGGAQKNRITIRHLLTHYSGLPAGRDLRRISGGPRGARAAVIRTSLESSPGEEFTYSDIGADILGFVVEAASGEKLDVFLTKRVYRPLGMRNTSFRPASSKRGRAAATGVSPARGVLQVHDGNARALGGTAGHAGLFSTASDLAIFARMMLSGGTYNGVRIVSDSTVALFTARTAGWRALGWDTCSGGGSCGHFMSRRAYGHTGFTGTSIWIDPDREIFVIVLSNWVNLAPERRSLPWAVISDVRADVADIAASAVVDVPEPLAALTMLRADRAIGWNALNRE
ncbi:MAG: serine hydrolase domain-containing protein [Gemmatimonadaceae bacterium]